MRSTKTAGLGYRGVIARFTGKACVAAGFIMGTYGLTEQQETLLQTGLGLLATGIVASAYGFYHWAAHGSRERHHHE